MNLLVPGQAWNEDKFYKNFYVLGCGGDKSDMGFGMSADYPNDDCKDGSAKAESPSGQKNILVDVEYCCTSSYCSSAPSRITMSLLGVLGTSLFAALALII